MSQASSPDAPNKKGKNASKKKSSESGAGAATRQAPKMSDEELVRAMNTVIMHRNRLGDLHDQWRGSMIPMGLLVAMVTMRSAQDPVRECIEELKVAGAGRDDWMEASVLLLRESKCELLNVCLAMMLSAFVVKLKQNPGRDFGGWLSLLTFLASLQLGVYFNTERVGCAVEYAGRTSLLSDEPDGTATQLKSDFPVSVIFYAGVMGTYWFMKKTFAKAQKNVEVVEQVQAKWEQAKVSKKRDKKTK